jgi:hypothetical protein
MAKKDFQERLDKNDKEFSIEKDGVEEDEWYNNLHNARETLT